VAPNMTWFRVIKNYVMLITTLQQIMQMVSGFVCYYSQTSMNGQLSAMVTTPQWQQPLNYFLTMASKSTTDKQCKQASTLY